MSAGAGGRSTASGGSVNAGAGNASGAPATGGNAGTSTPTNPSGATPHDSTGCGCSTTNERPLGHALLLGAVGLLALRRKRRAVAPR